MIYWRDWKEDVDFTAEVVRPAPFYLDGHANLNPTFDITVEAGELGKACDMLPKDRLGGITWYQHGRWSEEDFKKISSLSASLAGKQRELYQEATPEPERFAPGTRLEPATFAPDAAMWPVICLGELYRRDALAGADPVVPVVTFHQFVEGALESGSTDWHTSTGYLDAFIAFLTDHRFNTIPVETLAAYLTAEDKTLLPERPVAIIIDDGSASIVDHFEPRAATANLKYAIALVTDWMRDDEGHVVEVDNGVMDRILTWPQVKALAEGGRTEFISHSHALHHFMASGSEGTESGPATTERLWVAEENRQETEAERLARVLGDLAASRDILAARTGHATTLLVWPYGARDEAAEAAARAAGFTHFFEFGGSAFAAPRRTPQRIVRVGATLADEATPMAFPEDPVLAQRWWLAFLTYARTCQSVELIEATLDQLDRTLSNHPEAYISRAAVVVLQGHATLAWRRMKKLRDTYPHDTAIHSAVDEFEARYRSFG